MDKSRALSLDRNSLPSLTETVVQLCTGLSSCFGWCLRRHQQDTYQFCGSPSIWCLLVFGPSFSLLAHLGPAPRARCALLGVDCSQTSVALFLQGFWVGCPIQTRWQCKQDSVVETSRLRGPQGINHLRSSKGFGWAVLSKLGGIPKTRG